ncbi:MAG: hypothetical protein ACYSTG_05070 [Planctomycetota bacterium]|jgi:Skp family chaperone for outer membrane proteins
METALNQATSQETAATLQLNRPLLPIDEYATREGVSRDIVEECRRLGIVQVRKYKGKRYVVDVPLSPYRYPSRGAEFAECLSTAGATKPVDKTTLSKKISELRQKAASKGDILQKNRRMGAFEHVGKHTRPNDEAVKAGTSSALIEKIAEPSLSSRVPHGARQLFLLAGQVFRKALQIISKPVRMVGGKVTESKSRHESPQIIHDGGIEFSTLAVSPSYEDSLSDDLSVQPRSARSWQLAPKGRAPWGRVAVFSTILFFVALLVNIWFYAGRQTQRDTLSLAYANIQTVYSDFIKADRQVKVLRSELAGSKAEIRRIQNELDDSRVELQDVRNQLAEARQNLESIQQRNAQGMDRLHEQIQKLMVWVKESNKNSQPSSGSSTSGR